MLKDVLDGIKTFAEFAVKPLIGIAAASGFLLFAPATLQATLGTTTFIQTYRSWIGTSFVVSCAFLFAHLIGEIHDWIRIAIATRMTSRNQRRKIERLEPDEKKHLRSYILDRKSSVSYSIRDGVARGLEAKGILCRASQVGTLDGFPFILQPWAREILETNPKLLED
jgi:hypothetical protein